MIFSDTIPIYTDRGVQRLLDGNVVPKPNIEDNMNKSAMKLEDIFNTYSAPLRGYLKTHRIQDSDIDDLVSETIIEVYEKLSEYDPNQAKFYTWIVLRAKYRMLEHFNKQKKQPVSFECDDDQKIEPVSDESIFAKPDADHRLWAYNELLKLVFLCGGYPHEQLAFGFSKLILGTIGPRGTEGHAKEAQDKYGNIKIEEAIEMFAQEYNEQSHCGSDLLDTAMSPIQDRSKLIVRQVIKNAEDHLKNILELCVNNTALEDYIDPESNRANNPFTDWSNRVQKNIRRVMKLERNIEYEQKPIDESVEDVYDQNQKKPVIPVGCERCKLRHLPPCNPNFNDRDSS